MLHLAAKDLEKIYSRVGLILRIVMVFGNSNGVLYNNVASISQVLQRTVSLNAEHTLTSFISTKLCVTLTMSHSALHFQKMSHKISLYLRFGYQLYTKYSVH